MSAGTKDEVAEQGEITVQDDGSMVMTTTSSTLGSNISINFKPLGNEQWEISSGNTAHTAAIPDIMPLQVIAAIAWASHIAKMWMIQKAITSKSNSLSGGPAGGTTGESAFSYNGATTLSSQNGNSIENSTPPSPQNSAQTLCITHDLLCSDNLAMSFTHGGTSVSRFVPCVGSIDVNVLNCCKQHDVSLWCSQSEADLTAANAAVIGCILQDVLGATQDAYANSDNWWCKVFSSILDIITTIFDIAEGALYELINVLVAVVGDIGAALMELVTLGLLSQTDLNNILGFGGNLYDQDLWDPYGQHQQSCLCGGTVPTTQCIKYSDGTFGYDNCRDVCKEMGKAENCYQCNYYCVYQDGKPLPNKSLDLGPLDSSGNPKQPCCPGTDPNSGCSEIAQNLAAACPTCDQCNWTCKSSDGGTTWDWYHDPTPNGLPCCNDIPSDQICCDWDCTYDPEYSDSYDLRVGKEITDDWGDSYWQPEPPVGYSCGPVNQQDINDLSPCVLPSQPSFYNDN
ncbi:MAG: hypothetical protein ACHQNE_00705 [Candidatus Kapaibacterium sp.]